MTRDELIREMQARRGSWPALLFVYGIIVGTMVFSALSII